MRAMGWGMVAMLLLVPGLAAGKEPGALIEAVLEDRTEGWTVASDVGGTFSLTDSQSVVGKSEGTSATIGFSGKFRSDWNRVEHEWRTILRSTQKFTKTTELDQLTKPADLLDFESLYIHHWWDWGGTYLRLALDVPLFTGRAIEEDVEIFNVIDRDGMVIESFETDNLKISDAFEPLDIRPSLGIVSKLSLSRRKAILESFLGVGLRLTYAEDVLVVDDDDDTDEIELRRIDAFQQLGLSALVRLSGLLDQDRFGYQLESDLLVPFTDSGSSAQGLDGLALTSVKFTARLSYKPLTWLSLEYELRANKDPQIINDWQITNIVQVKLGFSFSYSEEES